jgi:cytochrome c553
MFRPTPFERRLAAVLTLTACGLIGCRAAPPEADLASGDGSHAPPAAVELRRGKYLARQVALCVTCHSPRDWTYYSGPPTPGAERRGGTVGVFGSTAWAPDISPQALAAWSVEALAGSLRARTHPDGSPLHEDHSLDGIEALDHLDARAIALYLTAKSGDDETGSGEPEVSTAASLGLDTVSAGEYLATVGRCASCHGNDLSGGAEIEIPGGLSLPSANLTPHETAGIGRMSRDEFIDFVKSLDAPELERIEVPAGEINTAMPWPWIAAMSRQDLGAIYDYLSTLPPVGLPEGAP